MPAETLRRFLRLSLQERVVVLDAAIGLMATWAGLRIFGFAPWQKFLAWLAPSTGQPLEEQGMIERSRGISLLHASAGRHLFFCPTCLQRALVLQWALRRKGIPAALRIGARKNQDRLEAHSWVEVSGVAFDVSAGNSRDFVPFEPPISSLEPRIR